MFLAYIFSSVKGKVVGDGKPVAGAVIKRTYDWGWREQKGGDATTTNDKGEFSLPVINKIMVLGSLFIREPFIYQEIAILFEGKDYLAWRMAKRNYLKTGKYGLSVI